jgi:hypothetical protein
VEIPRPLKSEGITNAAWVFMMFGVMLQFFSELELSSLTVSKTIGRAGRGSDKVTKIRLKGSIVEADEDIRAEAGGLSLQRVIFQWDGWGGGLQRIEVMHPRGRFGKFVSQNVRHLGSGIFAYGLASGACKAITDGIV